jgi:hypothetical protein
MYEMMSCRAVSCRTMHCRTSNHECRHQISIRNTVQHEALTLLAWLTSAPLSKSTAATGPWPLVTAMSSAVEPYLNGIGNCWETVRTHKVVVSCTSLLHYTRVHKDPFMLISQSMLAFGVLHCMNSALLTLFTLFTSAPFSKSNFTIEQWPLLAALIRAVAPWLRIENTEYDYVEKVDSEHTFSQSQYSESDVKL